MALAAYSESIVAVDSLRSAAPAANQARLINLVEAFLVAGSRSVVATLWNAEDTSASALMERFYERLAEGEDTSSALRDAKLDLLTNFGSQMSPYYWAGFIAVGETSTPVGINTQ